MMGDALRELLVLLCEVNGLVTAGNPFSIDCHLARLSIERKPLAHTACSSIQLMRRSLARPEEIQAHRGGIRWNKRAFKGWKPWFW